LFLLLVMAPIVIGTWLCQIYGVVIGSSIIWSSLSSAFKGHASFTYLAGYSNPLPLFQFNPGLGNFCFGWGILCSLILAWGKAQGNKVYLLSAAIFGIANLIVGLINLFGIQKDIGIHISGLPGLIVSMLIGFSIVISILQSWKKKVSM
jgi:hypothetical protein